MKYKQQGIIIKGIYVFSVLLLSLLFALLPAIPALAERVDATYGGSTRFNADWNNYPSVYDITHDSNTTTYRSGQYYGTLDFDLGPGVDNHTADGSYIYNVFVTKVNSDGSYAYTKTISSTANVFPGSLTVDSNGSIYFGAQYSTATDLDPGPGTDISTPLPSAYNQAIIKLNADGSYNRSYIFEGTGLTYAYDVKVDKSNNLFITGRFTGTTDFNPGSGVDSKVSNGGQDTFITKINADGSYGYTHTIGGSGDDTTFTLAIDSTGVSYATGRVATGAGTVDFDPGVGVDNKAISVGDAYFVTKTNTDGSYGGTNVWQTPPQTNIEDIHTDNNNNLYIIGEFKDTFDFDPSGGVDNKTSTSPTKADIFLTKFSANGTYLSTKTWGSNSSSVNEYGLAVTVDKSNNVYTLSDVGTNVDLDPGTGTDIRTTVSDDYAISKFDENGNYIAGYMTALTPGTYQYINGTALDVDNNYTVYLTAVFGSGSIDLNPFSGTDVISTPDEDTYITTIKQAVFQQITGLAPTLSAERVDNSVDATENNILNGTSTTLRLSKANSVPIADIQTTFNTDLDWSTVTADSDGTTGKAFAHNLTTVPGAATSFTLYIPKLSGNTGVGICPGASSLSAVNASCSGLIYLTQGKQSNISSVVINGVSYWKVTGLTGTGGFSTNTPLDPSATLANTGDNQATLYLLSALTLGLGVTILLRMLLLKKQSQ